MQYLDWTPEKELNIQIIDEQHKRIHDLVNELYVSLGSATSKKLLGKFNEIIISLKEHLVTEEELMQKFRFPGYISHKLEHDRFYNKMAGIQSDIESGDTEITLELLGTLRNWLNNHLEINDKKCGEFLYERGVR